jgi:3-oxoacyl-ACP reductase-like protein
MSTQNITSTNTHKLSGKVAIVTGASKGIGASIAKHLAAAGYVFSAIWRLVVKFFAGVQILLVSKKRTR